MDTPRTVLLVGVGLLGGSLALALRRAAAVNLVGADTDADALRVATETGAINTTVADWKTAAPHADLIVFCTPPAHIAAHIRTACDVAKPGAVVTDVGSVKGQIAHAAGDTPHYIGCHPMAGSEQGGISFARADLFDGAAWCVCPTPFSSQHATNTVNALANRVGANVITLPAAAHDELLAVTSHLPHVLAAALVRVAGDKRAAFPDLPLLSAGSFRDGTRVSLSSPALWRDICLANADAVRDAVRSLRTELDALDAALSARDAIAIEAFFAQAQAAKKAWEE